MVLGKSRDWAVPVSILAIFDTIVGSRFWLAVRLLGQPLSLAWAMVFGAPISPTDPVAVLATLKNAKVPSRLEVEMQRESFFNDGIGIVLFTVMLLFATCSGGDHTTVSAIAELLGLKIGVAFVRGSSPRRVPSVISFMSAVP